MFSLLSSHLVSAANTHHQQGSLNATSAAALSVPAGLPANQIASNTRSRSFTSYAYPAPNIALPRKSVGQIEIDLTGFSIYDRTSTPRSSDMDDNVDPNSAKSVINSTSSGKEAEVDIIKIPRSKGNESFRVEASRTGTPGIVDVNYLLCDRYSYFCLACLRILVVADSKQTIPMFLRLLSPLFIFQAHYNHPLVQTVDPTRSSELLL